MNKEIETKLENYSSITPQSYSDKVKIFNWLNGDSIPLKSFINTELEIKDIICQKQEKVDENGETREINLIIFVSNDEKAYSTISKCVFSSLCSIIELFGFPDEWENPITIIPFLESSGGKNFLKIKAK